MRVGFVVDHPKRDLGGAVMLAHALAGRGIEAVLVPLYYQAIDVPLLALDALVVNFARPVNLELVRAYADSGIAVFVLDTEGGVLADDGANTPHRLAEYVRDSGYVDVLSGYFFWGSILHDAFVQHSGMRPESLHLTGCPRFDFASSRWREILDYPRDGFVLMNANFPLVNPRFVSSPEQEVASVVAAGWDADYVVRILADSRKILDNYLETVPRLAERFPEQSFLVRPHPFENAELYRKSFESFANVTVDGSGSVLNAIQHARCVLHVNCGTAIEAIMLGKLPLSMEFLNTQLMSRHSSLPSQVSRKVGSIEELLDVLVDTDAATSKFPFGQVHAELVRPWFHLADGGAADRVAVVLRESILARGSTAPRPSVSRSLSGSRPRPRIGQRLQALLANGIGSLAAASLRSSWSPARREKSLTLGSIRSLVSAMCRHESAPAWQVSHARHPSTGVPLSSVIIAPGGAKR